MSNLTSEDGATMVEYGFLLAGIAIVVAIGATSLGEAVRGLYDLAVGAFG